MLVELMLRVDGRQRRRDFADVVGLPIHGAPSRASISQGQVRRLNGPQRRHVDLDVTVGDRGRLGGRKLGPDVARQVNAGGGQLAGRVRDVVTVFGRSMCRPSPLRVSC